MSEHIKKSKKPKVKPLVISPDSEEEIKKDKPIKVYDNYEFARNIDFNKYIL